MIYLSSIPLSLNTFPLFNYQFIRHLICTPSYQVRVIVARCLLQLLTFLELNICTADACGCAVLGAGGSAGARLLGLRVRIPPGGWMSVSCWCCVLPGPQSPTECGVSSWVWHRNLNHEKA